MSPFNKTPVLHLLSVCTRKTRILDVVYNASNNELVRTKTLVKNAIVVVSQLFSSVLSWCVGCTMRIVCFTLGE